MARKARKWYVVIVGKDPGVYETWAQASPLVNGVPGALHESFNTEEEARLIFTQAKNRGATRAVGCRESDVGLLGLSISTDESSTPRSIRGIQNSTPRRMVPTPVRETQSPRPSTSALSKAHTSSSATLHADLTYTRGFSSSNSSSTRRRQPTASRIYVRTPSDLLSYPSDDSEEHLSRTTTLSKCFAETLIVGGKDSLWASDTLGSGEPKAHLHAGRVSLQTSSFFGSNVDGVLSPLDSPKFFIPDMPSVATGQAEYAAPLYASCSPRPSKGRPHTRYDVTSTLRSAADTPTRSPPETLLDPRSPLQKTAYMSSSSFSTANKGRPSPNQSSGRLQFNAR